MSLFSTKRFLPLFITQFLGAFNDNMFKNALVMLVTYRIAEATHENAQVLVTLAAGLFMLPFFLFSATAGQLADKYDRAKIAQAVKVMEIILMTIASAGFYTGHVWMLMFVLFMMGVHSTFFGPIKYALLPQHLMDDELLKGNAYVEAGTFLAILLGTIFGGLLILHPSGVQLVSCTIIICAFSGFVASRQIPSSPAPDNMLKLNWNIFSETKRIIEHSRRDKRVFLAILGISWFWLIGITFLSQFPTYAKDVLHSDETVVTLFLTLFSVGIGAGSFICTKLLRGKINSRLVPYAAIGITVFTVDLFFASGYIITPMNGLMNIEGLLANIHGARIAIDLFLISVCGGIYIVPLYTIMQHYSDSAYRARIIAANNVLNSLFMVCSAIITLIMLKFSFTIPHVFLTVAIVNGFMVILLFRNRIN